MYTSSRVQRPPSWGAGAPPPIYHLWVVLPKGVALRCDKGKSPPQAPPDGGPRGRRRRNFGGFEGGFNKNLQHFTFASSALASPLMRYPQSIECGRPLVGGSRPCALSVGGKELSQWPGAALSTQHSPRHNGRAGRCYPCCRGRAQRHHSFTAYAPTVAAHRVPQRVPPPTYCRLCRCQRRRCKR